MTRPTVDLVENGLLPAIPAALLGGGARELLRPIELAGEPGSLSAPEVDRRELAAAMAVANAGYGHRAAEKMARKLADPATRVVVTGQQPGLLGGPLYTLSKAVAATLWAERLEAAGQPAVAVFWVATEDHDFREVARTLLPTREGSLELDLGVDPSPLMPVGMRTLGPELPSLLEQARRAVPGDRWGEWIDRVSTWYRPDARFGEAFSRLLAGLLGERCPLLLDSMLPALKTAQRPWMRRIVERRREIDEAFQARDRKIAEAGFDLQIKPSPGASPLFFLHGEARRRIEWRGEDRIGLRGASGVEHSTDWLLGAIDENPSVVSPGVLARVALQDATLGSSLVVLGPGELSYLTQVAPLYEVLGVEPSHAVLRPQALVLSHHQTERLDDLGVTLEQLVAPDFDLDRETSGGEEANLVQPVRNEIDRQLERLREIADQVDSNLASPMDKTQKQVERALETFTQRLGAAVARGHETRRGRLEDLRLTCRPGGGLQERAVSSAYFPGRYGDRFVESLFEQLSLDPSRLQVVAP